MSEEQDSVYQMITPAPTPMLKKHKDSPLPTMTQMPVTPLLPLPRSKTRCIRKRRSRRVAPTGGVSDNSLRSRTPQASTKGRFSLRRKRKVAPMGVIPEDQELRVNHGFNLRHLLRPRHVVPLNVSAAGDVGPPRVGAVRKLLLRIICK